MDLYTPTPHPEYTLDEKMKISPLEITLLKSNDVADFSGVLSACVKYSNEAIIYFGDQSDIVSRSNAFNTLNSDSFLSAISRLIPNFEKTLLTESPENLPQMDYFGIHLKGDNSEYLALVPSSLGINFVKELLTNKGFVSNTARKTVEFDGFLVFPLEHELIGNQRYIDPAYIYNSMHHLSVAEDGVSLLHENGSKAKFIQLKEPLELDTKVVLETNPYSKTTTSFAKLYLESDLNSQKEWRNLERERKNALLLHESKLEQAKIDKEDKAFNDSLNIPFDFDLGYKIVLSGLLENSSCTGTNKSTVMHVIVGEDFQDGRLVRKKGEFLCKASNSKMWNEKSSGGRGRVTCKQCLKVAKRWAK